MRFIPQLECLEDRRLLSGFSGSSSLLPPPSAPTPDHHDDGVRLDRHGPGGEDHNARPRQDNRGPGSGDRVGDFRPDQRGPGDGSRPVEQRQDNRGPGNNDQPRQPVQQQTGSSAAAVSSQIPVAARGDSSGPGNNSGTAPRTENQGNSANEQRQLTQTSNSSNRVGSSEPQSSNGRTGSSETQPVQFAQDNRVVPPEAQLPPPGAQDGRPGPRGRPDPALFRDGLAARESMLPGIRPEAIAGALGLQPQLLTPTTPNTPQDYRGLHEWAHRAGIDLDGVRFLPQLPWIPEVPGTVVSGGEPGAATPPETATTTPAETLGFLPVIDFQALESGVRQFLNQLDDLAAPLVNLTGVRQLSPWLVALIAAGAACEITRRQVRYNARQMVFAQDFLDRGTTQTW